MTQCVGMDDPDGNDDLANVGYKQVLNRGMDGFMSFAIGYTEVSAIVSVTSIFGYGLATGGPVMAVWGWLITFAMTMSIAYNFAEICSVFPTAGSVYHWSGVLAPREWSLVAAYWTGLFNLVGNTAGDASFAYIFAVFVSAALVTGGSSELSSSELVALAIIVLFMWSILNCFHIQSVGWLTNVASVIQISTVVSLIVVVLATAPTLNSGTYVFAGFYNDTGFSQIGYVVIMSFLFPLFGFAGYDGPAHLAEETKGSSTAAPMGIVYTVAATGVSGFVLILALLFAMQDIADAIDSTSGNSAIQIVQQTAGQNAACAFSWLLVVNIFFAGMSSITVTSRILFALCRDKATAYSEFLTIVHPTLGTPIYALMFLFCVQSALLLLPLTSDAGMEAFYTILSICVVGLQVSYMIPIALKAMTYLSPAHHVKISSRLDGSRMSLGAWSFPLGVLSSTWLFFTTLLLLLPTTYPVDATSMNYTIVAVAATIIFGQLNWLLNSKHTFEGPPRLFDDPVGGTIEGVGAGAQAGASGTPFGSNGELEPLIGGRNL